jgi:hypothetical protein
MSRPPLDCSHCGSYPWIVCVVGPFIFGFIRMGPSVGPINPWIVRKGPSRGLSSIGLFAWVFCRGSLYPRLFALGLFNPRFTRVLGPFESIGVRGLCGSPFDGRRREHILPVAGIEPATSGMTPG